MVLLHVEDDDNDAVFFTKACQRIGTPVELRRVVNGERAKAYLQGNEEFNDRLKYPIPGVIILDLKMPLVDGFEFLKWIRHHDSLSELRVLVFTASLSSQDKTRALDEGANSYFVKPSSFEELTKLVEVFTQADGAGSDQ
jgi:two-component system response regulator